MNLKVNREVLVEKREILFDFGFDSVNKADLKMPIYYEFDDYYSLVLLPFHSEEEFIINFEAMDLIEGEHEYEVSVDRVFQVIWYLITQGVVEGHVK